MTKLFKVLGGILLVGALAACGKTQAEKTKEKVDTTNSKVERMNAIGQDLKEDGIYLGSYYKPFSVPTDLTEAQVRVATKKLKECIRLGNDVLDVGNDDDVIFTGKADVERYIENARTYLKLLSKYEYKTKETAQAIAN
ncbi:MAG TPA: hypothetical protein VM432_07555 [Bdellovibrionales bacterium]|nr:hypothetical protein [Bdellovibrionales bacterium]